MTDALERLRQRNRAEITLSSGITIGYQRMSMLDALASGQLPLGAVDEVLKRRPDLASDPVALATEIDKEGTGPDWLTSMRILIARCVRTIDGEPVEMSPEDVSAFTDQEFMELANTLFSLDGRGNGSAPRPSPPSRSRTKARSTGASASSAASTPERRSKPKTT